MQSSDLGAEHDHCPTCGTDNEPFYKNGSGEHQTFALYVCGGPKEKDDAGGALGCGTNWERTTRAGAAHNAAVGGIGPEGKSIGNLLPSLQVGRTWSLPSQAYRNGYDLAFGRFTFRCGHTRKLSRPEGTPEDEWIRLFQLAGEYDCDDCDPEGQTVPPFELRWERQD